MNEPILIVEDNLLNLKLAKITLEVEGFEVQSAMNAQEALHVLASFEPKLILMDIQMPYIDGLELTQKLKADPRYSHIKIVAMTAFAMKGDKERTLAAGCDGYISKPIDPKSLVEKIRYYLDNESGKLKEMES